MGKRWTEREEKILMQMVDDKADYEDIAAKLERSKGSVVSKAKDMRQRANMPPKEPKQRCDAWKDHEIDMPTLPGDVARVQLVTDGLGNHQWAWAVWGEPRLVGEVSG